MFKDHDHQYVTIQDNKINWLDLSEVILFALAALEPGEVNYILRLPNKAGFLLYCDKDISTPEPIRTLLSYSYFQRDGAEVVWASNGSLN